MGVRTLISEEEYLRMSFDDRAAEYVDGELVERSLPNKSHSRTQARLVGYFEQIRTGAALYVCPELRVRVAEKKYRIVDAAVYAHREPTGELPLELPLIVIEIVSPDDRYEELMQRLEEFRVWGVPNVWLVDPGLARIYVYSDGGVTAVSTFEIPEFDVLIPAEAILK